MSPELIRAALMFLQRVDIKGGEAMAMVQVCSALEAMMRQSTMPQLLRPNGMEMQGAARGLDREMSEAQP